MEKKKLLLVAVSVGVFLAIAISASILIFTPGSAPDQGPGRPAAEVQPLAEPETVDAADMVRNAEEFQTIQPPPEAAAVQPAPAVQPVENNIYIDGKLVPEAAVARTENGGSRVTIKVPVPSSAAVPAPPAAKAGAKPAPAKASSAPAPAEAPAASPAKVSSKPAAKPAAAVKPAPKASPAKTAALNSYWVQTGAFSGRDRAEGAKETLAAKGITSIIEDRDVEGKTWYRVRVGPYTSETEAKYWLSLVKSIDGFGESQIRTTAVQ